jgi:hypothetical protein
MPIGWLSWYAMRVVGWYVEAVFSSHCLLFCTISRFCQLLRCPQHSLSRSVVRCGLMGWIWILLVAIFLCCLWGCSIWGLAHKSRFVYGVGSIWVESVERI